MSPIYKFSIPSVNEVKMSHFGLMVKLTLTNSAIRKLLYISVGLVSNSYQCNNFSCRRVANVFLAEIR